jgi:hypothetical protein
MVKVFQDTGKHGTCGSQNVGEHLTFDAAYF